MPGARARIPLLTLRAGLALALMGAASCGGKQQVASDMTFAPDELEEGSPSSREAETESLGEPPPPDPSSTPRSLVGVRPDLALSASAPATARCSCLSVEVGAPSDPKFQWQAGAPKAGPGALAIAVSARGIECPGGDPDDTRRRPSISAVDVDGSDVIVEIEELPDGPPLAAGALIPEPGPGGSVYVRGRSKGAPYARSSTSARCKVR